jgi:hypothetical protein
MYTAFAPPGSVVATCNVFKTPKPLPLGEGLGWGFDTSVGPPLPAPPRRGGEVLRILRALRKGPVAGALPQRRRPRSNGCGEGSAISGPTTWSYGSTAGGKDASPPCRSPAPQGRAGKSPPDPSRPFATMSASQACRVRHPSAGQPVRFSLGVTPRSPAGAALCLASQGLTRRREGAKKRVRRAAGAVHPPTGAANGTSGWRAASPPCAPSSRTSRLRANQIFFGQRA